MKGDQEFNKELERLYAIYQSEVVEAKKEGLLSESTARTYLLNSKKIMKWCKNEFQPVVETNNDV